MSEVRCPSRRRPHQDQAPDNVEERDCVPAAAGQGEQRTHSLCPPIDAAATACASAQRSAVACVVASSPLCQRTRPPPPPARAHSVASSPLCRRTHPPAESAEPCVLRRVAQGVDLIAGGRTKTKHRTTPKSENVYVLLLVKVSSAPTRCARRWMPLPPPARAHSVRLSHDW